MNSVWRSLLAMVILVGCSDSNALKPKDFEQRIRSTPNAVVLDVRTPKETRTTGVIEGAQVSDFTGGEFESDLTSLDKSKTYFVYCASGMRSSKAGKKMKKAGFENVFVLDGGIKAWEKEGLPLVPR